MKNELKFRRSEGERAHGKSRTISLGRNSVETRSNNHRNLAPPGHPTILKKTDG